MNQQLTINDQITYQNYEEAKTTYCVTGDKGADQTGDLFVCMHYLKLVQLCPISQVYSLGAWTSSYFETT